MALHRLFRACEPTAQQKYTTLWMKGTDAGRIESGSPQICAVSYYIAFLVSVSMSTSDLSQQSKYSKMLDNLSQMTNGVLELYTGAIRQRKSLDITIRGG